MRGASRCMSCSCYFRPLVDYTHGLLVAHYKEKGNLRAAKISVASSMIINLALLGFFKYCDFFIGNINLLFGSDIKLLNIALPIGISFYTFQTMSYTIDVYRGDAEPAAEYHQLRRVCRALPAAYRRTYRAVQDGRRTAE